MGIRTFAAALALPLSFVGLPVQSVARDVEPPAPPALYRALMDCRQLGEAAARLACFDRHSAALEEATVKHEIVISDKAAVQAAERGLFGFAAPVAKLMGFGGGDDSEELTEIETTVIRVGRTGDGWRLHLADGSTWEQNDTRSLVLSPKVGNAVRISRGTLGTYLVSVQGQRAIKMRRTS